MENNTSESPNGSGKRKSTFSSFLVIVLVCGIIGFVTIIPGKNNLIKEFPDLMTIIKREIWFMGIPALIGLLLPYFNKRYNSK
jgi:hypothetical protein